MNNLNFPSQNVRIKKHFVILKSSLTKLLFKTGEVGGGHNFFWENLGGAVYKVGLIKQESKNGLCC